MVTRDTLPDSSIDRILAVMLQNLRENFSKGVTFDEKEPYVDRKVYEDISTKKVTLSEGDEGLRLIGHKSGIGTFALNIYLEIFERISTDKDHRSDLDRFRSDLISHILNTRWNIENPAIIKHIDGTEEEVTKKQVGIAWVEQEGMLSRKFIPEQDPDENYSIFGAFISFNIRVKIGQSIWEPRKGETAPEFRLTYQYPGTIKKLFVSDIEDPPVEIASTDG